MVRRVSAQRSIKVRRQDSRLNSFGRLPPFLGLLDAQREKRFLGWAWRWFGRGRRRRSYRFSRGRRAGSRANRRSDRCRRCRNLGPLGSGLRRDTGGRRRGIAGWRPEVPDHQGCRQRCGGLQRRAQQAMGRSGATALAHRGWLGDGGSHGGWASGRGMCLARQRRRRRGGLAWRSACRPQPLGATPAILRSVVVGGVAFLAVLGHALAPVGANEWKGSATGAFRNRLLESNARM